MFGILSWISSERNKGLWGVLEAIIMFNENRDRHYETTELSHYSCRQD